MSKEFIKAIKSNDLTLIMKAIIDGVDLSVMLNEYKALLTSLASEEYKPEDLNKRLVKFLGYLFQFVELIEKNQAKLRKKYSKHFPKIEKALKDAKDILKQYDYRDTDEYQANSAILFLTMLAIASKENAEANPNPQQAAIRDQHGDEISLGDIAKQVLETTGVSARTAAFVALGVTRNGRILATTNYHAPRIYDLETLLDKEKYEAANTQYKNAGGLALSLGRIHAETMIAAVSTDLQIDQLLIADQSGLKKQNCLYCAHYLTGKGFTNEPHFEKIKNYDVPTKKQIDGVVSYLQDNRLEEQQLTYCGQAPARRLASLGDTQKRIFVMLSAEDQASVMSGADLYQEIIYFILRNYPKRSKENQNESVTNMYAETLKLSNHRESFYHRQKVHSKAVTNIKKPNTKLSLQIDKHIDIAKNNRTVKASDPGSPRSNVLARLSNRWLAKGTKQRVETDAIDNVMRLTRVMR